MEMAAFMPLLLLLSNVILYLKKFIIRLKECLWHLIKNMKKNGLRMEEAISDIKNIMAEGFTSKSFQAHPVIIYRY